MRPVRPGAAALVAALVVAAGALGAGGALDGGADDDRSEARPRAAASVRGGSFTQLNSRAGSSIFTADALAPGDSVSGVVTITNAGSLGGRFTLSAADVSDTPGPGAGKLSARLGLSVVDLTAAAAPATVYAGALAAMPPRELGYLRPGEARTYRFTATLPDGGPPPSASGGDNAFAGSSARVRFVWKGVDAAGPPAPPPASPAAPARDRRAPRLRLSVPRVQRVLTRGYLALRARCDEPCRLDVSGTVRAGRSGRALRLPPVRGVRGRPGRVATLRVRVPARLRGRMRRVLLRGDTVTMRLRTSARDRAGNRAVAMRTVRLRRR